MDDFALLSRLHDGVFTTTEAARAGVSREMLCRAVSAGQVRRLARGLYASGVAADRPEDRHAELCRALGVEYPDAVLAGRSAVVALGLPTWGVPLGTALLHRPVERQLRRSGAVIRPVDPAVGTVDTPLGRVTPPDAALVQLALDHGSLAGVVSTDAALQRGIVHLSRLERRVAERAGHRRIQRALAMMQLVDGASESPGESRLRVTLAMAGIDTESQVGVTDGLGDVVARADLRVSGTRVLIEFDGRVKYADGGVDAVVAEKLREDRLRALGWAVVRVTWTELASPAAVVARVRRAIALSRRLVPTS